MSRKEFAVTIMFNGKERHSLIIDDHFKKSHPEMSHELIMELIQTLDGGYFEPQDYKDWWQYYAIEPVFSVSFPIGLLW